MKITEIQTSSKMRVGSQRAVSGQMNTRNQMMARRKLMVPFYTRFRICQGRNGFAKKCVEA